MVIFQMYPKSEKKLEKGDFEMEQEIAGSVLGKCTWNLTLFPPL